MFEKRPLQKMFSAVPRSYDFLNRLLTFGFDQVWRQRAAEKCLVNSPERILDLCCGTGDLTVKLKKTASSDTQIVALDYSETMLEAAKKKLIKKHLNHIDFYHADASNMPFPDDFFDSIGIAFAFRNLTFHNPDRDKFLEEIQRVLKPGGRFVIIETSQPDNNLFRKLFHLYLKWITAPLGGFISGHYRAYNYLAYSARHYYNNEELQSMMIKAGFKIIESRAYLGGISSLYVFKI